MSGDDAELVLRKLLKSTSIQILLILPVSIKINNLMILKGIQETDPVSGHHHIGHRCAAVNHSRPDEPRQAFFHKPGPFFFDTPTLCPARPGLEGFHR